jgi:hypothetical protein
MHAHFCVGRLRKIPEMMADSSDSDMRAHITGLIEHCPSGPYTYALVKPLCDGTHLEIGFRDDENDALRHMSAVNGLSEP